MKTQKKGMIFLIAAVVFLLMSNWILSQTEKEIEENNLKLLNTPLAGKEIREAEKEQNIAMKVDLLDQSQILLIEDLGSFKIVKDKEIQAFKRIVVKKGAIKIVVKNVTEKKLSFMLDKEKAEPDEHTVIMAINPEQTAAHTVVLDRGKYFFYCPINPTPRYELIVN